MQRYNAVLDRHPLLQEQPLLKALPDEVLETGLWLTPRVDRYGQIHVRMNKYSVPTRLIGRRIRVLLHACHLVAYDGRVEVARHERMMIKGGSRLVLDHYLEALVRKPGAFPGSTALDQARAAGKFTAAHEAWWAAVGKAHGDTAGIQALIEVRLLHRRMPDDLVVAGLTAALRVGALTADAVALEARKAGDDRVTSAPADPTAPTPSVDQRLEVASLTARRLALLPPDTRPLPSVAAYEQLLPSRRKANEGNPHP